MHKVRFTLWMDEDVLKAARARASESGVKPSRVIADAARAVLLEHPQNAEAKVLKAVERVFSLVQRTNRHRDYDQQVLKEMVGLLVQSFFNHTPAVPERDKKAALLSGKARFNRFLDALAMNLRGGESILNDVPAAPGPRTAQAPTSESSPTDAIEATAGRSNEGLSPIEPSGPQSRERDHGDGPLFDLPTDSER